MNPQDGGFAYVNSMNVACGCCGRDVSIKPEHVGKKFECPFCRTGFTPSLNGLAPNPKEQPSNVWEPRPPKRLKRSDLQCIDILANEVSRAAKGHPRHALFL